jgi:hypothetical protein
MSNAEDQTRDTILRHLYEVHRKAKSPKSAGVPITKLAAALKPKGYKQSEVARNLDYLIQKGWVREVILQRTFTTPRGTTQQAEKRLYKVSDVGIDRLESASTYQRPTTAKSINITNIRGVTVIGEGNIVNTTFTDLSRTLEELRTNLVTAPNVPEDKKLEVVADIDSFQAQLQKPSPSKTVVKALWASVEKAATVGGFVDLVSKATTLLAPLVS